MIDIEKQIKQLFNTSKKLSTKNYNKFIVLLELHKLNTTKRRQIKIGTFREYINSYN